MTQQPGRSLHDTAGPAPSRTPIAIVGAGVVTPGANDPGQLWDLLDGPSHVFRRPRRFDMADFHHPDPLTPDRSYAPKAGFITGFTPHDRLREEIEDNAAPNTEPTARWLRHTVHSALSTVRCSPADRCFAAFGYTADGSAQLENRLVGASYASRLAAASGAPRQQWAEALTAAYPGVGIPTYEFLPHRVGQAAIEGILPEDTELVMVDTACSSSLYALDLAVRALREGSSDLAVCGGAFAVTPRVHVLFSKIQGLSRAGEVRAFDRNADGVLFSDGAACLILKNLDRACEDGDPVLGVIEGIGLSCDGRGRAIYAPNPDGQRLAVRRAYDDAGISPAQVRWVIAHGTGTPAGDGAEVDALNSAADASEPALLSGNKSILGHTGWSAGAVSLVHALLGLERGEAPAQRFVDNPVPELDGGRFSVPRVRTALHPEEPRRVGVSAFGFGGTNAHVLVRSNRSGGAGAGADMPDRPSSDSDPMVLLGWGAELPGHDAQATTAWLRGSGPAPAVGYPNGFPLPGFREVPLPPTALRGTDRTQLMLLAAMSGIEEGILKAAAHLRDTTGVVVGHMGPTRHALDYSLRCHLGVLTRLLGEEGGKTVPGLDRATVQRTLRAVEQQVHAQVPAADDSTLPGIMPNIIPARLAALSDFHGLNVMLDSGPDSGLDALRAAERYLRDGTLDLVFAGAVNGNTADAFTEILTPLARATVAEGAFMLGLSLLSTARQERLPVLATLRTRTAAHSPQTDNRAGPLREAALTYLGADPLVSLLSGVLAGRPGTVSGSRPRGSEVRFTVSPGS